MERDMEPVPRFLYQLRDVSRQCKILVIKSEVN